MDLTNLIQLITAAVLALLLLIYFYLWKRQIFIYRFYKHRDDLLRAAFDNKISKNNETFVSLYFMITTTIALRDKFKISDFVKRYEGKKISRPDKIDNLVSEILTQDPIIIRIAGEFANDFIGLMYYNNPLLLVLFKIKKVINFRKFPQNNSVYKYYSIYKGYKHFGDMILSHEFN